MQIYGDKRSGNCDKVLFVADYLKLKYRWVELDSVNGETRTADFLGKNPMGQIPFLALSNGSGIAQSNAIIRYLAKGSSLMPLDDYLGSKVDAWMFWEANNHEFFVAGCISHMPYMGKPKASRDPMRVKRGEEALQIMDAFLAGKEWFVGGMISLADIALLAYTRRAHLGGFEMDRISNVRDWINRSERELGLKSALPQRY